MTSFEVAQNLAVASLIGLAIGIERQRSGHASGPNARFAGVRTFFLLGLIGGTIGWLAAVQATGLAVALLAGISALVVAAYVVAARRSAEDVEATTEVAGFSVLCLGLLAGQGELGIAAGGSAVVLLALAQKGGI